jgi:hypothetical protein
LESLNLLKSGSLSVLKAEDYMSPQSSSSSSKNSSYFLDFKLFIAIASIFLLEVGIGVENVFQSSSSSGG